MKRENWEVKDYGIRPAGSPNHCFYCNAKKGGIHKKDCVIRSRTIVMEMKIEIVMEVPESWDEEMCNFHKNQGSWCATNIIDTLKKINKVNGCLCSVSEFKYIREATDEDEKSQGVFVNKFPS